jgi:hypothetical protein
MNVKALDHDIERAGLDGVLGNPGLMGMLLLKCDIKAAVTVRSK